MSFGILVFEVKPGDSTRVQGRQGGVDMIRPRALAMHILRIDEAATDTWLHVDEVELDNTGNQSPFLFIDFLAGAFFSGQFQINT